MNLNIASKNSVTIMHTHVVLNFIYQIFYVQIRDLLHTTLVHKFN